MYPRAKMFPDILPDHINDVEGTLLDLKQNAQIALAFRNGPLEKLLGGGEFSSRRNFFFVIRFLVWIVLGHGMNSF